MNRVLDPAGRRLRGAQVQGDVGGQPAPAPRTLLESAARDFLFGEVWSRPQLDRRARYLISIAAVTLNGADDSLIDFYVRGALKAKELSLAELREAALHLAGYGNLPRAIVLDRAITRAEDALDLQPADCPPLSADPDVLSERIARGEAEFLDVMTFGNQTPPLPFLEAISGHVFGEIWTRPGLDQRARRWLTLVGVAESNREVPMKTHFHAAMASGNCSVEEMHEFVLHYAAHAGWHKASSVLVLVFEMAAKIEKGLPWDAPAAQE
ncbi:MAG: carboxymuconolactone decarboxylase family protein [Novosphingobium sp.]